MTRIAINGFGRIGRQAFKAGFHKPDFNVVAINDLTDAKTLAYLLKYDSNYGIWNVDVKSRGNFLIIDGRKIPVYSERDPANLPWAEDKIDVVIESTGFFRTVEAASKHLEAGAKRVVISAPAKDEAIPTYVIGANEEGLKKEGAKIINNASCTTNCASPVMAIMDEAFGVKKALLTTIHGYTSTQSLVDSPQNELRRGRAAAVNMIPTSTGAAIASTKTLPQLKNKFDGISIRVPVPTGSISDITMVLSKKVTVDEIKTAFKSAIKKPRFKKVVAITEEPLVSTDIIGNEYSAIVDLEMTRVVGGDLVKILAWYDNEWGYSNRLAEMAVFYSKNAK